MNIVKISQTSFDSQIKPKVYKMLNKVFFKLKILFMNGMISEYFFSQINANLSILTLTGVAKRLILRFRITLQIVN